MQKYLKYVLLIVAIFYTIFPVDLIPDAIPIAGWLDDIGIDIMAVRFLLKGAALKKSYDFVRKEYDKAKESNDTSVLNVINKTQQIADVAKQVSVAKGEVKAAKPSTDSTSNSNTSNQPESEVADTNKMGLF